MGQRWMMGMILFLAWSMCAGCHSGRAPGAEINPNSSLDPAPTAHLASHPHQYGVLGGICKTDPAACRRDSSLVRFGDSPRQGRTGAPDAGAAADSTLRQRPHKHESRVYAELQEDHVTPVTRDSVRSRHVIYGAYRFWTSENPEAADVQVDDVRFDVDAQLTQRTQTINGPWRLERIDAGEGSEGVAVPVAVNPRDYVLQITTDHLGPADRLPDDSDPQTYAGTIQRSTTCMLPDVSIRYDLSVHGGVSWRNRPDPSHPDSVDVEAPTGNSAGTHLGTRQIRCHYYVVGGKLAPEPAHPPRGHDQSGAINDEQ